MIKESFVLKGSITDVLDQIHNMIKDYEIKNK